MRFRMLLPAVIAAALFSGPARLPAEPQSPGIFEKAPTTLTGTVVQLMTIDPHAIVLVDVKDAAGQTVRWQAILAGQQELKECFGWNKATLQAGDSVTLTGHASKSGAPLMTLFSRGLPFEAQGEQVQPAPVAEGGATVKNGNGEVIFRSGKAMRSHSAGTACAAEGAGSFQSSHAR